MEGFPYPADVSRSGFPCVLFLSWHLPGRCEEHVCSLKDRSVVLYETKDAGIRALHGISALQQKLVHIDITLVPWTNK